MNMDNTSLLKGNLGGIQHLGVPVTSLETSVKFYQDLGFERIMSAEVPEGDDAIQVAMMKHDNVIIELYQLTGEEREALKNRSDGHIDHIAFNVKDIDQAFEELKSAGFDTIEEKPVFLDFWEKGCKYFAIRGPDGEKLEFNQIL
jgi:catechol 2,3-dioxygenase-like lactoylglutathione lyase family enzyme